MPFKFMKLQRAAHSTKLQCLFLSSVEIKQSYGEILWLSIPTVFRHVGKHPLATFQNQLHVVHMTPQSSSGSGCGWIEGPSFNQHSVSHTSHYSSCLKSVRLTFWITNWKIRQFSKDPSELFKDISTSVHHKSEICGWTHKTFRNLPPLYQFPLFFS